MIYYIATFIAIIAAVNGKIYFKENFNDASWESRWVVPSEWKPKVWFIELAWLCDQFH